MSRRAPNAAADRAAQNQQTIKSLLKLEGNKNCADCKRNKHPRWASWNLGIFVCIRCSGIHRGMGTHISRVKSVDLDAWTDEQLQSVLRWGNARANKYWEAKLAPGHVPSEAKIENFIRTKYESKRWVMDGPIPDPATLDDEGDDDVPLNLVQEKAKLELSSSQRVPSGSIQPPPTTRKTAAPMVDLFGDDAPLPPARPSTTDVPGTRPPPLNLTAPSRQSKPDNSLLGLDFFGSPNSAPPSRSASSASNPLGSSGPSRPDLKQSILSLYASKPSTPSQPQNDRQASFGGLQSPLAQPPSNFGGLDDAFSGLSFTSATSPPAPQPQQQPKSAPFPNFTNMTSPRATPAAPQVTPQISGGGFFNTGPKQPPKPVATSEPPPQQPQVQRSFSQSSGFGDFSSAPSTSPPQSKPAEGSAMNDIFDFPPSPTQPQHGPRLPPQPQRSPLT
ncbi:MAG: stromal membrane-associated [Lasallia pustulata]|uniref:Stromal membrane-associated n=1 Tax=Lasallia pustulata TaxID=136370 RepID=A0A5M8PV19_9LECA|nr:MAG: stromal membrane-associated [Lasallia pustulata]